MFGLVNCIADVSEYQGVVQSALAAYVTQAQSLASAVRQRRYAAAYYRCPHLAETFWEMSAGIYQHLHSPAMWSERFSFYGLRPRPWSDPLAYLRDRARKQHIAVMAHLAA